jgi:hypothetical protein
MGNSQPSSTNDLIIWQLFSYQTVRDNIVNKLLNRGPITNEQWPVPDRINTILSPGNSIQGSTVLISPGRTCKLEVSSDGILQLKANIYACKKTGTINTDALNKNNYMFTDQVNSKTQSQPFYIYKNELRNPTIQQTYYHTDAFGYKTLQPIDKKSPIVKNSTAGNAFQPPLTGYGVNSDFYEQITTTTSCTDECNKDPNCNYVYVENNTTCYKGNNDIPYLIPNNNNSNLYIRNKMIDLGNSITSSVTSYDSVSSSSPYYDYHNYNIDGNIITNAFNTGPPSLPLYKNIFKQQQSILFAKREHFNNYKYYNPTQACSVGNSTGCQNSILKGQINPLAQMAQDYQNQNIQMDTTRSNIKNSIDQYNTVYNIMNNNAKYDFSGNQPFNMEDNSLQNVMQQDTKQLLLQENNFYIAGSILTTTLLITAIYLAR